MRRAPSVRAPATRARVEPGLASLGLGVLLLGCGAGAFSHGFEERREPEVSIVLRALESVELAPRRSVAVLVVREPRALRAVDLSSGETLFEEATPELRSTPLVAGSFVVTAEGQGVIVRRLDDGRTVGRLAGQTRLLGASGDGARVVVSLAEGSEQAPLGRLFLVTDGGPQWEHELPLGVGVAALASDVVVVPWATQRVSFLDASDGHERARVRFSDRVVGRAWLEGTRVLLGQHDVWAADRAMADPSSTPSWRPAGRSLPGQPPLLADGYVGVGAPEAADSRVRLEWRAAPDAQSAVDDVMYFVFYRLVFALEASSDAVRWVRVHPRDVVGARAIGGGLWLADEAGHMVALAAADGRILSDRDLGTPLLAAAMRPDGAMPALPADAPAAEALATQLFEAARLQDNRLGGGRGLAARHLAAIAGADVTGHLVQLCADRSAPEPTRRPACDGLATRTEGAQHVRAALEHHGSFLAARPAPPVGALARAAASMRQRALVMNLVGHLADPSTPSEELADLLRGLGELGSPLVTRHVQAFVRLYHATEDPLLRRAVVAGAQALARLNGTGLAPQIAELERDTFTPPPVLEELRALLAEEEAAARLAATPPPRVEPEPEPAVVDQRPERITAPITRAVFAPAERALRRCNESSTALRISMVVGGNGEIGAVLVTPVEARACVEPIVHELRFPETRAGIREQVVHRVGAQ